MHINWENSRLIILFFINDWLFTLTKKRFRFYDWSMLIYFTRTFQPNLKFTNRYIEKLIIYLPLFSSYGFWMPHLTLYYFFLLFLSYVFELFQFSLWILFYFLGIFFLLFFFVAHNYKTKTKLKVRPSSIRTPEHMRYCWGSFAGNWWDFFIWFIYFRRKKKDGYSKVRNCTAFQ